MSTLRQKRPPSCSVNQDDSNSKLYNESFHTNFRSQGLKILKSLLSNLQSLVRKSEYQGEEIIMLREYLEQLIGHMKDFVKRVVAMSNLYCVMLKKINYVGKEMKTLNDHLSDEYTHWKTRDKDLRRSHLDHLEKTVKEGANLKMDHIREELRKLQAIDINISLERLHEFILKATDVEIQGRDLLEITHTGSVSIRDQNQLEKEFQETLRVVMDLGRESLNEKKEVLAKSTYTVEPEPPSIKPKQTVKLRLNKGGPLTDPSLRQGSTARRSADRQVPHSAGLLKADEFSIPHNVNDTPECPSSPSRYTSEVISESPFTRPDPPIGINKSVGDSTLTKLSQKSYLSKGVGSFPIQNQFSIVEAIEESLACAMTIQKRHISLRDQSVSMTDGDINQSRRLQQNEIMMSEHSFRQKSIQFSALVEKKSLVDESIQYDEPNYYIPPEMVSVANSAIEFTQPSQIDQEAQYSQIISVMDHSQQIYPPRMKNVGNSPIMSQSQKSVQEDILRPMHEDISIQADSFPDQRMLENE